MIPALAVFGIAIVLAWALPLPLGRLSRDGVSPRLGLAAWLTAIISVLALALAALGLLARTAAGGWPSFARTVCESVTTGVCPPAVYRSAAYELGLAAVAFAGGITLIVLGCRYGRSLHRASISTREHAEAARIVGRRAGGPDEAFVLDAARPAVYCVPGRPPVIVLTTGALAVLDPEQLAAVLAHERAHLAGAPPAARGDPRAGGRRPVRPALRARGRRGGPAGRDARRRCRHSPVRLQAGSRARQ